MTSLLNVRGKLVKKNVERYRIDWDKPCRSNIQFVTKQFLKPYWLGHVVYEEFPVYGTRLKVDIINLTRKIAVEIQGKQHHEFNKHFHKNRPYEFRQSMKRDVQKCEWLELNGFLLLEVLEDEIELLSEEYFFKKFGVSLK